MLFAPARAGSARRAATLVAVALLLVLPAPALAEDEDVSGPGAGYRVLDVVTDAQRDAIARTGAAIEVTEPESLIVTAAPAEIARVEALGFETVPLPADAEFQSHPDVAGDGILAAAAAADFPAGHEGYHTIPEANAEILARAQAHPAIVRRFSIGQSYQGRSIQAVKVSDNVTVDEDEPEVMFDGLTHAREHMSLEMTLAIYRWLVDGYGSNSQITRLVNTREIWIVFAVNPDGAEYDIQGGSYRGWRKNRQPNPGSSYIGTDLNRNYDWHWGCCRGSETFPGSNLYRGPSAFSAPETRHMRDFVRSRVVNGRQQIKASISFHTSGRLVMWSYGYTYTDVPPDMTQLDHDVQAAIGRRMAASNGYKPEQGSDLYISSGTFRDWAYGEQRIYAYTFELTTGSYPDDSTIASETGRNRTAVLHLLERAACPQAELGLADVYCGAFWDDLEIARGWRIDPNGTDTATGGAWQRGIPQATSSSGVKQIGRASTGRAAFVTAASAGASASANDLDGGVTTVQSPLFRLPGGTAPRVRFDYSFAHSSTSSSDDYFRVRIVSGSQSAVLFQERGAANDDDGAWARASVQIPAAFAGTSARLVFEAADRGTASLVEAMFDEVAVMRP
jgi:carboxypeptidase T